MPLEMSRRHCSGHRGFEHCGRGQGLGSVSWRLRASDGQACQGGAHDKVCAHGVIVPSAWEAAAALAESFPRDSFSALNPMNRAATLGRTATFIVISRDNDEAAKRPSSTLAPPTDTSA